MIDKERLDNWRAMARRDDWHLLFVGSDIREMLAEIERLRGILIDANNTWRHDFALEVEAATDKLYKKLAAHRTDPFGRRIDELATVD